MLFVYEFRALRGFMYQQIILILKFNLYIYLYESLCHKAY